MKRKVIKLFLMGMVTASVLAPTFSNTYAAAEVVDSSSSESSSSESSSESSSNSSSSSVSTSESSESSEEKVEPSEVSIRVYNKTNSSGETSASVKITNRRTGNTVSFDRNSSGEYTYNSSGNYRYLEPNSNGYITVYGLSGSFTVEDAGSSSDVVCDTDYKDFSVSDGGEASVQIDYVRNYGSVSIQLLSEDDSAISDAYFVLKDRNGNRVRFNRSNGNYVYSSSGGNEDIVTSTAGMATLTELPTGTYTLEQTSAPVSYNGDLVVKSLTVESQKQTSLSMVNTKHYGDLSIRIVDNADNSVTLNGEYYIKDASGNFIYVTKSSDGVYVFSRTSSEYLVKSANGDITITGVPKGTYTLIESTAPAGFKPSDQKSFDIMKDYKTNVQMQNDRATGSLTIYIADDTTGDAVAGAEYQLLKKDDESVVSVKETEGGYLYVLSGEETFKTNEEGKIQITGIPTGTYLLKQVSAAEGYLIDIDAVEQIIDTDTETVFNTTTSKSNSAVFVTNNDGEPVAGVAFNIVNADGEILLSDVTNENGKFLISGILAGDYSLVITGVPEFYSIYKDAVSFSLDETGMSEGLGKIVLKYSEIKMNFGVQDLEVFMKNKADDSVISVMTDENGVATFSKIGFGEYTIYIEKENIAFEPIEVTVDETFESMDLDIDIASDETIAGIEEDGVVVKKKVNNGIIVAIIAAVVGVFFGGYLYYEKYYKKKKAAAESEDDSTDVEITEEDLENPKQFVGVDKDGNTFIYEEVDDDEYEEDGVEANEDDLLDVESEEETESSESETEVEDSDDIENK